MTIRRVLIGLVIGAMTYGILTAQKTSTIIKCDPTKLKPFMTMGTVFDQCGEPRWTEHIPPDGDKPEKIKWSYGAGNKTVLMFFVQNMLLTLEIYGDWR